MFRSAPGLLRSSMAISVVRRLGNRRFVTSVATLFVTDLGV
jgi:hypothetical protein